MRRMAQKVASPLRILDKADTLDLQLDTDDLMGDLDPGWLEWRSRMANAGELRREVA